MEELLRRRLRAYDTAALAHELVHGGDFRDLPAAFVVTARDVIRARLDLYTCLTDAGWTPPSSAVAEMDQDETLLRQGEHPLTEWEHRAHRPL